MHCYWSVQEIHPSYRINPDGVFEFVPRGTATNNRSDELLATDHGISSLVQLGVLALSLRKHGNAVRDGTRVDQPARGDRLPNKLGD